MCKRGHLLFEASLVMSCLVLVEYWRFGCTAVRSSSTDLLFGRSNFLPTDRAGFLAEVVAASPPRARIESNCMMA